jgi:hypothetical protein
LPNKINALVIGDSHALDAYNALVKKFPIHNFSLSEQGGCPPYKNIERIVQPSHPDLEKCKILNLKRHDVDFLKKFDYIVINNLHEWYNADHLESYLYFLKKNGVKKVIVFGAYFSLSQDMSEIINKFGMDAEMINKIKIAPTVDDKRMREITSELGYLYISKMDAFCDEKSCQYFDKNNIPFTYDKHHLSYEFANKILLGQEDLIIQYLDN